jgi:hypothetical protein
MAKRAKQVDKMVESINYYLKANRIINELCTECMLMTAMLLSANCYRGFNWFYENEDGIEVLVGSGDPSVISEKDGYLKYY